MSAKKAKAKIVQFADETKTLPDGSKVIYAENDDKIVLYHKPPFEKGIAYLYERHSGKIFVNNKEGTNQDKRRMLALGAYFMENATESDMVTISVHPKGGRL
ncbi:MAG: hypothetical protein AB7F28_07990 [Candidatus Margulisiibacteriota bacterium]